MPHEPTGPIDELRDNITGSAAGDYSPRIPGDDIEHTQAPLDADISPLDRPASEEKPRVREPDADGAPEL